MTGSIEATPPVQEEATSPADSDPQSKGADSAAVSLSQSLVTPLTTPLKNEPNELVKDEPNLSQSTASATHPPSEGVTQPDPGLATQTPGGQLSNVLSRLKKRVLDTAWQGSESKVGQLSCKLMHMHY